MLHTHEAEGSSPPVSTKISTIVLIPLVLKRLCFFIDRYKSMLYNRLDKLEVIVQMALEGVRTLFDNLMQQNFE